MAIFTMMKISLLSFVALMFLFARCSSPADREVETSDENISWPDSIKWWKANNLRVIQANLPAYEGGLNADSLVADLLYFSANTLIINAGGIMAFYPTKLDCQYTNPHMKDNMLKDVIAKCHEAGIRQKANLWKVGHQTGDY